MCGSNPELSPEVNSAKCIGGTALGFAIVTLVGFAIVPWGLVSALAGRAGFVQPTSWWPASSWRRKST